MHWENPAEESFNYSAKPMCLKQVWLQSLVPSIRWKARWMRVRMSDGLYVTERHKNVLRRFPKDAGVFTKDRSAVDEC